jgi:phage I-like protein
MRKTNAIAALPAGTAVADQIAVASATGEPLKTIQVLPIGRIKSKRDGREWLIRDAAHAQEIVAASIASAAPADIPADYDHQIMFAAQPGVGGTAEASGWLTNLRVEGGFIVADPDWTDEAAAKITAKKYRYISPVFGFDGKTREISRVLNVALTNFPAITELAAVASADLEEPMDLKAIAKALGLSETATAAECATAASAAMVAIAAAKTSLTTLATAAGLTDADPTAEAIATAITAARAKGEPDPRAFVPMASFKELQAQVTTLQNTGADAAATTAVDAACTAGKITPAGRDHALKLFKASREDFAAFIGAQPAVIAPGAADTAAARANLDAPLTKEETAAARAIGITDEAFIASKKQLAGVR